MKLVVRRIIYTALLFISTGCEEVEETKGDTPTATACTVADESRRVVFTLTREGVIGIDDVRISLDQLRAIAKALVQLDPDVQLKLLAEKEVDTSRVKGFTEAAYGAGIKGVVFGSLVTEQTGRR